MQIGDFVVLEDRFSAVFVVEVKRITGKCFYGPGRWSSRDHRYMLGDELFTGKKEETELLRDRLVSSRAQYDDDCRRASERKQKRDQEFVTAAASAKAA